MTNEILSGAIDLQIYRTSIASYLGCTLYTTAHFTLFISDTCFMIKVKFPAQADYKEMLYWKEMFVAADVVVGYFVLSLFENL